MAKTSRTALLDFLDYLANKGLINANTAAARKAAANKILGVLDDDEAEDLTSIDVDGVVTRFYNLEGAKYTPDSLSAYKSRLKSALDDFFRYQKDPLNFKPAGSQSPRKNPDRTRGAPPATAQQTADRHVHTAPIEPPPASVSILPIPIRPDLVVKIQGLPFDLTQAEANKIANVVKAMAVGD